MMNSVEKRRPGKYEREKAPKLANSTTRAASVNWKRAARAMKHLLLSTLWNGDTSEIDPIKAANNSRLYSGSSNLRRTVNSIRTDRGQSA